jgi:hypothetical protein
VRPVRTLAHRAPATPRRPEAETSGYVTDEFLRGLAEEIQGLDVGRWEEQREGNSFNIRRIAEVLTSAILAFQHFSRQLFGG